MATLKKGVKVITTDAEQDYNKMSWLYHALYGEMSAEQLVQLDYVKNHNELLRSYNNHDLSILDSACGNGVQATALALNGYHVTATDISNEMVKLTREFAKKHDVEISTAVKAWCELPETFKEQFNIVFCTGNSIVHSANADDMKVQLDSHHLSILIY
jgi:2-polyprenyl-3-methyl-5-hydroxy-6-metoxy-1,4-benzoquinol methylase